MTDALSRWYVKPEPVGNQLGTSSAAGGSQHPLSPLGEGSGTSRPTGTATAETIGGVLVLLAVAALYARRSLFKIEPPRHPYGMTDAETLDCLGPSWSAMTLDEQDAYGPAIPPRHDQHAA